MADAEPPAKKSRIRKPILSASEKKRRKRERGRVQQKTRVVLGDAYERWCAFKTEQGLLTDRAVAEHLLDQWQVHSKRSGSTVRVEPIAGASGTGMHKFSTPVSSKFPRTEDGTPSVSEISELESERDQPMSGVEEVSTSGAEDVKTKKEEKQSFKGQTDFTSTGRTVTRKQFTDSFIDPFNLSIEVSDEIDSEEDGLHKDEDYEPSFCFTAVLPEEVTNVAEDVAFEEIEFNLEPDEEDMVDEPDFIDSEEGIRVISSEDDSRDVTMDVKCVVFLQQLLTIASYAVLPCSRCKEAVEVEHRFIGSAVYIRWICGQKHLVHQWCSQPLMNRKLHTGDFLICSTILTSGNNFSKMLLWAKQLNLKFPSSPRFHSIQRCYMLPAIESAWTDNLAEVRREFQDKDIVIMGDGRNDSPGHSAQYCSYTLMEYETKKIIALHTIDKRQTERKSVNMEKRGFIQALNEVQESGLTVTEVVTDAHLGISSVMKKEYPEMRHSYDIWHVAKNLGKKIVKASQKKENAVLMQWSKDIINHFWFSCQKAETYSEFVGIWRSVLHHVTNQHEWIVPHGGGLHRCLHEPLTEETRNKPWLHPSRHSHVLKELTDIVLNQRLLKNVEHFLNFRSTAELEGFHQHILMYCAKRFAYTPPVYRARNLLAALDHNKNADRGVQKNKDGSTRYHRTYNKKSGRWSVYACREQKRFDYVKDVLVQALNRRLNDPTGMYRRVTLEPADVRLISKTIAPVEPPPTQQLVQEQQSRFT